MNIEDRITGEIYSITVTVIDWVNLFTRPPDVEIVNIAEDYHYSSTIDYSGEKG